VRSIELNGAIPYTTLIGERPVALLGALLYANSAWARANPKLWHEVKTKLLGVYLRFD